MQKIGTTKGNNRTGGLHVDGHHATRI